MPNSHGCYAVRLEMCSVHSKHLTVAGCDCDFLTLLLEGPHLIIKGSCLNLLPRHLAEALGTLVPTPAHRERATPHCPKVQALTLRSSSRNSPVTSGRLEKVYWTLPSIPRGIRAAGKGGGHRGVPSPSQTPSLFVHQGVQAARLQLRNHGKNKSSGFKSQLCLFLAV